MAGAIVGIVALPLAIAFAIASDVGPEKGLITAVIAGIIISALGGSRVQIGGPTGAFVVIVAGIIASYGLEGLIISTIMAGVMMLGFGLLRLGSVIRFVPYPLTVGFTSGIAILIFTTQIRDFFGFDTGSLPADFVGKIVGIGKAVGTVNWQALVVGGISLLLTLFWGRLKTRVPGSLIALLTSVIIVHGLGLNVETIGSRFGEIPSKLPMASFPTINLDMLIKYLAPAFTIAMLGSIESLLSAVVADGMIGGRHRSNTELIAQGLANIASGLFGGIPATGAIARTATNVKNGGRTPIAGIVHAVTLLLIMLFLGKWAKLIPLSCLAGILMVVAYNMSEYSSFRAILKGSRYDILVLLSTFFLTVLVDLTVAIQIGMVLAAFLFMKRMSDVGEAKPLTSYPEDEMDDAAMVSLKLPETVKVFEISGPLFFGVANRFNDVLNNIHDHSSVIVIRMRNVPMIDATGIHNFKSLITNFLNHKKTVILSGISPLVLKELERNSIVELTGEENIYTTFEEALERARELGMEKGKVKGKR